MTFKEGSNLEQNFAALEEIFLSLTRLNDPVTGREKLAIILRSLPDSFLVIALMAIEKRNALRWNVCNFKVRD